MATQEEQKAARDAAAAKEAADKKAAADQKAADAATAQAQAAGAPGTGDAEATAAANDQAQAANDAQTAIDAVQQRQAELDAREKELEKRQKELDEQAKAAREAQATQIPTLPGGMPFYGGPNFNLQTAMQEDANLQARNLGTNEVPTGPVYRVPVHDPITGRLAGWQEMRGDGTVVSGPKAKDE